LPSDLELGPPLNDERLAVAYLLYRVLISAERNFMLSFRGIEARLGHYSTLDQVLRPLQL